MKGNPWAKEFAATGASDMDKASTWLKEKAGRKLRSMWLGLPTAERNQYFEARLDSTFPLDEAPNGIYDERRDHRSNLIPVTTPMVLSCVPTVQASVGPEERELERKIVKYKDASVEYSAALRVVELLKLSQFCNSSDTAKINAAVGVHDFELPNQRGGLDGFGCPSQLCYRSDK